MKVSFSPTTLPTFVVGGVLDASHSDRGEVESMARDGEHFFLCFLALWISSFENFCLVQLPTSLLVH
jgi:hypothetical protein